MAFGFIMMPLFALGQAFIDTVEAYAVFKACYRFPAGRPRYVIFIGRSVSPNNIDFSPSKDSVQGQTLKDGQIPYRPDFAIHWDTSKLRRQRLITPTIAHALLRLRYMRFSGPISADSIEVWKNVAGRYRKKCTIMNIGCPLFLEPTECLVDISYHCGDLCAAGYTLRLRKNGKRWRIVKRLRRWCS